MSKYFKIPDCNFALLSADKQESFAQRYCNIFQGKGDESKTSIILVSNKDTVPWRNVYLHIERDSAADSFVSDFRELTRHSIEEVSGSDMTKILYPEPKFRDYAYCCKWGDVIDNSLLRSISNKEGTVTILTIEPVKRDEAKSYVNREFAYFFDRCRTQKMCDLLKEEIDKARQLRNDVFNDKNLFRIKLEVATTGDTPEEAAKKLDSVIKVARNYFDVSLRRKEHSRIKLPSFLKRTPPMYSEQVIKNLIPFYTVEIADRTGFEYGVNALSKNPVIYNRRSFAVPNSGFIIGNAGSGKTEAAKAEIEQLLSKTHDEIIIIDDEGEYSRDEKLKDRITDVPLLAESDYHINIMDMVLYWDGGDDIIVYGEPLLEKQDEAVMFLETLGDKKLNVYEADMVKTAVKEVFEPFIAEMKKRREKGEKKQHFDFSINPTFADIVKRLRTLLDTETVYNDDETKLINAVSEAVEKNRTFNNNGIADMLNDVLHTHRYNKADYSNLMNIIGEYSDFIKTFFCYQTNVPAYERAIQLSARCIPNRLRKAFYAVALSYVNTRRKLKMLQVNSNKPYKGQYIWTFWENAHILFSNEKLSEYTAAMIKCSRTSHICHTFITQNFRDVTNTEIGESCIANAYFNRFLNQSMLDRNRIGQMFNLSDEQLEYINDKPAGLGLLIARDGTIPFFLKERNSK